jgi:hypothetical protein
LHCCALSGTARVQPPYLWSAVSPAVRRGRGIAVFSAILRNVAPMGSYRDTSRNRSHNQSAHPGWRADLQRRFPEGSFLVDRHPWALVGVGRDAWVGFSPCCRVHRASPRDEIHARGVAVLAAYGSCLPLRYVPSSLSFLTRPPYTLYTTLSTI